MMRSEPRKRRLLVITFHFPPDGSVGGNRWAGLSKYLARRGWEVHIVTAAAGDDFQMPDGVHRHFRARRCLARPCRNEGRILCAASAARVHPSPGLLGPSSWSLFDSVTVVQRVVNEICTRSQKKCGAA